MLGTDKVMDGHVQCVYGFLGFLFAVVYTFQALTYGKDEY